MTAEQQTIVRWGGDISSHAGVRLILLALAISLGGCSSAPEEQRVVSEAVKTQPPPTQVFFYPTAGQTPERQDRDRYECYLWAVKQTGFDPSQPLVAANVRVEVLPMPEPGHDTAVGALTGGILGAAISRPRDTVAGAVIGAITGAAIGSASDASRSTRAERVQDRYDQLDAQRLRRLDHLAQEYRRAMAVCLEGRGYKVH